MKVAYAFRRLNDYFEKVSALLNSGIESIESKPDHLSVTFHQDIDIDFARKMIDSALQSYVEYSYDNYDKGNALSTFDILIEDTEIFVGITHRHPETSKNYAILNFETAIRLEELEQYYDMYYLCTICN